ncbi:MAG: pantoate--beta-alanine ligase [Gammaproteobacteria bacterium]|nr:pantoate--beta-alanine ligase [Gammaproteobacteria bacterium]
MASVMQILDSVDPLQTEIARWKRQGHTVGLVPTMGDLHEGHLSLVRQAREKADRLVVSLFVNPLQFGPGEDFDRYPRRLDADSSLLGKERVDILFVPGNDAIYPQGTQAVRQVSAGDLASILCGVGRPGHFDGVATVVKRLFEIVQPDLAVFGQKDYQQLLVIRRLVAGAGLEVDILGGPTFREADGLAMSTRNRYLNAKERAVAPQLYAELQAAKALMQAGGLTHEQIVERSIDNLTAVGFRPVYFELRRATNLSVPGETDRDLVLLTAAYLGETRLIDNLLFSL